MTLTAGMREERQHGRAPHALYASAEAELIARFEGFVARPYNDAAGHATIGFGHLLHRGPVDGRRPVRLGIDVA